MEKIKKRRNFVLITKQIIQILAGQVAENYNFTKMGQLYHAKKITKSDVSIGFIAMKIAVNKIIEITRKIFTICKIIYKTFFFICYSHFLGFLSENVRLKKFIFFFGSGGVNGAKIYMQNIHNIML